MTKPTKAYAIVNEEGKIARTGMGSLEIYSSKDSAEIFSLERDTVLPVEIRIMKKK